MSTGAHPTCPGKGLLATHSLRKNTATKARQQVVESPGSSVFLPPVFPQVPRRLPRAWLTSSPTWHSTYKVGGCVGRLCWLQQPIPATGRPGGGLASRHGQSEACFFRRLQAPSGVVCGPSAAQTVAHMPAVPLSDNGCSCCLCCLLHRH